MKILRKRTYNKKILALFLLLLLFLLLRLPSLIEPYWYGDEGIYQVIGQSLHNGNLLYTDIYDNKPPLLYVLYSLVNGDQVLVRTLSLLMGGLSVIMLFFLSLKLFNKLSIAAAISGIYTLLFATPLIEGNIANAENFILLLLLTAGYIIYVQREKLQVNHIFIAGIILGFAFLFKIIAVFDFIAFFVFLLSCALPTITKKNIQKSVAISLHYSAGFLLPIFITFLYFFFKGNFAAFFQASFFGNVGYVGWKNDLFGIPQGLLIIKSITLLSGITILFVTRKKLTSPVFFILIWLCFSLFSAFFSGRPYTHYVLVLLPVYCLSIGLFLSLKKKLHKLISAGIILSTTILILSFFPLYDLSKTFFYYQNAFQFVTGKKSTAAYQNFFDPKVSRDYAVADFITSHTNDSDNVFIWGNNAQIYALSHKTPITKYTVAYHVTDDEAFSQTQRAIDTHKPKYIIVLKESSPLPFRIPLYIMRFSLEGAYIYERSI